MCLSDSIELIDPKDAFTELDLAFLSDEELETLASVETYPAWDLKPSNLQWDNRNNQPRETTL